MIATLDMIKSYNMLNLDSKEELTKAICQNDISKVENLIKYTSIEPYALVYACEANYVELVKYLIENGVCMCNDCLIKATEKNNIEIVNLLLNCSSVDPTCNQNYCICVACERGYVELVRIFLNIDKVNPSDNFNEALKKACSGENLEIIQILLEDSRIDLTDFNPTLYTNDENIIKIINDIRYMEYNDRIDYLHSLLFEQPILTFFQFFVK